MSLVFTYEVHLQSQGRQVQRGVQLHDMLAGWGNFSAGNTRKIERRFGVFLQERLKVADLPRTPLILLDLS